MLASFFLLPFSFPLALSGPKEVVEQQKKEEEEKKGVESLARRFLWLVLFSSWSCAWIRWKTESE